MEWCEVEEVYQYRSQLIHAGPKDEAGNSTRANCFPQANLREVDLTSVTDHGNRHTQGCRSRRRHSSDLLFKASIECMELVRVGCVFAIDTA